VSGLSTALTWMQEPHSDSSSTCLSPNSGISSGGDPSQIRRCVTQSTGLALAGSIRHSKHLAGMLAGSAHEVSGRVQAIDPIASHLRNARIASVHSPATCCP
jgi:hypothetical protein